MSFLYPQLKLLRSTIYSTYYQIHFSSYTSVTSIFYVYSMKVFMLVWIGGTSEEINLTSDWQTTALISMQIYLQAQ